MPPSEEGPGPIFLDTNVVQALATFGSYIYDRSLTDELRRKMVSHGSRYTADIEALAKLIPVLQRMSWPLVVSPVTLLEHREYLRLDWDIALFDYFVSSATAAQLRLLNAGTTPDQVPLPLEGQVPTELDFLPDANDRALIDDALSFDCKWFLTLDYRSIWRFRDRLAHFGIKVVTPSEAVAIFVATSG